MNIKKMIEIAEEIGFSNVGIIETSMLEFRSEVRDMCAANKCNYYGSCWTCPPASGTLEDIRKRAEKFSYGILLQETGKLEDSFDVEGMLFAENKHKEKFYKIIKKLTKEKCEILPMPVGACTICDKCTYPNGSCRFPEKAFPSMESYGLVVSDTCKKGNIKYYYGHNTITYTGLICFN